MRVAPDGAGGRLFHEECECALLHVDGVCGDEWGGIAFEGGLDMMEMELLEE